MTTADCAFCDIATGRGTAVVVREWDDAVAVLPRGGVTEGHLLVLPRVHVEDAGTDPDVTAAVMRRAAELMAEHGAANLITSRGAAATQTVFHLHVHVVPRRPGDGLMLPWSAPDPVKEAARG
ncbi:MAG TPA: HIT domain-containing protein [Umezawaea sp.]|nr:HIT domain-containing protein [Umezawaea sp.]